MMFEPTLLRTFLAVAETRHFTAAGRRLGLSQSTVSQHIRKLELASGRLLLARDTHTVALTPDGVLMAGFAREILEASQRAVDYFSDSAPRGKVRFGVSEDLALTRLPDILRSFTRQNPLFGLELSVGLTSTLYQKLDAGRLDLVFAKRPAGDERGEVVKTEELCWIAHEDYILTPDEPVPLVLYGAASITSTMAVDTLNRAGRSWLVACSSETLGGIQAGALAGLGVTAQSRLLLGTLGLAEAPAEAALPRLEEVEFVVLGRYAKLAGAAAVLADIIREHGPSLW